MMTQNTLTSKQKHPNSEYYDIELLAYIPTRKINDDVEETGIMLHPIEVYLIENDLECSAPQGQLRFGAGGALYKTNNRIGKKYIVHKGNSRVRAAIKMGYTHIEGYLLHEWTAMDTPEYWRGALV